MSGRSPGPLARTMLSREQLLPAVVSALVATAVLAVATSSSAAKAAALLLGCLVVLAASRRPVPWLAFVLVLVATQQIVLALALQHGAPLALVKAAGGLKEAVTLGLVLRVVTERRSSPRRSLDVPDVFALLLLGVVAVYFLAPLVGLSALGGLDTSSRLLAARQDGLFALLFLVCRRLHLPEKAVGVLRGTVLGLGLLLAAGAVVQVVWNALWFRLVLNLANVPMYRYLAYGIAGNGGELTDRSLIGGHEIIRAGSFVMSDLALGFVLVVPFALALSGALARRASVRSVVIAAACAVGVLLTLTRSAILACLVAGAFLAFTRTVPSRARHRLKIALVAIALLGAPIVASSALSVRVNADNGRGADTQQHVDALRHGFSFMVSHPLGTGLGSGAGVGQRVGADNTVTAENTYLGYGNELGVGGFLAFTGLFLGTVWKLVKRARGGGGPLVAAMAAAGCGLAVGGMFLHVFVDIPTALVFWTMAGLALPPAAWPRRPGSGTAAPAVPALAVAARG